MKSALLALLASVALILSLSPAVALADPWDDPWQEPVPDPYGYAPYQGQVSCSKRVMKGTKAFSALIVDKFGGRGKPSLRGCKSGGLSEHKEGRAFDWTLNAKNGKDRKRAKRAFKWLTKTVDGVEGAHAKELGVMYVIWNRRMWRAYDADRGWSKYKGSSPHRDHMHISLSWSGAGKNTSYWTDTPIFDYGPCQKKEGKLARPWRKPRLTPCPDLENHDWREHS